MIDWFEKYVGGMFSRGEGDPEYWGLKKSLAKKLGVKAKDIEISRFDGKGVFGTPSISSSNICSVKGVLVNTYNFVADVKESGESYLIQSNLDYELLAFRKFERLGNSNRKGIEDLN
ncbi:hypothetical protein J4226_05265 [Candidatus Pacearchaeota archaeon]|nr:hypothetical protein [Candidatus Pacearchaeota archaeon]